MNSSVSRPLRTSDRGRRSTRVAALSVALTLVIYGVGFAHAVVYPKSSTAGGHERYVLRVPNERTVPTTRIEIQFPAEVKVSSFIDVPGWKLEVKRDSAKRIIGAVWTGSLPPERFIEFPFVAVNPKDTAEVHWPVFQTYGDTGRVEWTGPAGSKTPASATTISAAPAAAATPETPVPAPVPASPWIAYAALAVSIVSLGLALRKGTPNAG